MKTPAAKSPATPAGIAKGLDPWWLGGLAGSSLGDDGPRQVRDLLWSFMAVLDVFSARQGVILCHLVALRGSFVHFCGSKVATEESGEGKCGRVVPMDVLQHRKYT